MTELDSYHIESIDHSLDGRHYIFRDSDYIGTNFTCASGADASYLKASTAPKVNATEVPRDLFICFVGRLSLGIHHYGPHKSS